MSLAGPTLLVMGTPPDSWVDQLASIRALLDIRFARTPGEARERIHDVQIVYAWESAQAWLKDCWDSAEKIEWVQSSSAGLERILFPALVESPIPLVNGQGLYGPALAEFVLFCALYFAKQAVTMERNRRARRWQEYRARELRGQAIGIVGYGGTGRATARLAKSFGMTVLATKRNLNQGAGFELVDDLVPPERWHDLLARSDYVVNALPLTPDNQGVFGEAEFRAMKTTACFINVGRGKTVQEALLIRALQEGWIAGAGLDVFETEPLPADNELYSLPNVIISPHCADQTDSYYEESARLLCENVHRYLQGEPLKNVVDKKRGY